MNILNIINKINYKIFIFFAKKIKNLLLLTNIYMFIFNFLNLQRNEKNHSNFITSL